MNEFLQLLSIVVPVTAILIVAIFQNGKLREIHVLVNSQLSDMTTKLAIALDRIGQLERTITGLQNDAIRR